MKARYGIYTVELAKLLINFGNGLANAVVVGEFQTDGIEGRLESHVLKFRDGLLCMIFLPRSNDNVVR